jgi:GTP pyrophosphokinase
MERDLDKFLEKFEISKSDFDNTKLEWTDLLKISDDYKKHKLEDGLEQNANILIKDLSRKKGIGIHSISYRIKNTEHLIDKIIRKKNDDFKRDINIANYKNEITDLIGIRILHLFKEDWITIHDYIIKTWKLKRHLMEKPIAYIRKGDDEEIYKKKNCKIKIHPRGYRSVHYIIKESSVGEKTFLSEIQVRTIFEEGWSRN